MTLSLAIAFSTAAHEGQVDRAGGPFIGHPLRVMAYVAKYHDWVSDEVLTAAVLHDTVEDTDATLDQIGRKFGAYVEGLVDALTRRENETYEQYITRIINGPKWPKVACIIKLEDVRDNMDARRVWSANDIKWHESMVRARYAPTRVRLEAALIPLRGASTGWSS